MSQSFPKVKLRSPSLCIFNFFISLFYNTFISLLYLLPVKTPQTFFNLCFCLCLCLFLFVLLFKFKFMFLFLFLFLYLSPPCQVLLQFSLVHFTCLHMSNFMCCVLQTKKKEINGCACTYRLGRGVGTSFVEVGVYFFAVNKNMFFVSHRVFQFMNSCCISFHFQNLRCFYYSALF